MTTYGSLKQLMQQVVNRIREYEGLSNSDPTPPELAGYLTDIVRLFEQSGDVIRVLQEQVLTEETAKLVKRLSERL